MGDREGRPYAGLVAELFGCRGDACRRPRYRARRARRRPCRFPDGLVRVGTGRRKGVARHLVRRKRSRAGFGMGDREGRPYAGLVAELFGCRGDAIAPAGRAVAHAGFPMASFGSVRDAARAWHATSYEGNEAVPDSGWATARVAPTRAWSPSCSGVGATLSRPQGAPSPMPVSRWPRSGRYGTPQGRGTPPRTKETKPCRIRDGRPRGSPLRGLGILVGLRRRLAGVLEKPTSLQLSQVFATRRECGSILYRAVRRAAAHAARLAALRWGGRWSRHGGVTIARARHTSSKPRLSTLASSPTVVAWH